MSSNTIEDRSMIMKIVPNCTTAKRVRAAISKGVIGPSAPDARKMNMGNAIRRAAHPYGAINRLRILASLHRLYLPQSSVIRLMLELLIDIEPSRNLPEWPPKGPTNKFTNHVESEGDLPSKEEKTSNDRNRDQNIECVDNLHLGELESPKERVVIEGSGHVSSRGSQT